MAAGMVFPQANHLSFFPTPRIATIKKIQGLFFGAVSDYTAVLELESSYVPALKGTMPVS